MNKQEHEEKVFKTLFKFVVFMAVLGGILLWFVSQAGAVPGYPPTRQTWSALASAAQPLTASGTALPAITGFSEGDLFALASTTPCLYRLQSGAWVIIAGGGGTGAGGVSTDTVIAYIASETILREAHVASQTDPHGASMTVTESLSIGSGPYDCFITRLKTGTISIASAGYFPPLDTAPEDPATGTIYFDIPTNHLMLMKSGTWQIIKDGSDL